jgi:hypothetical protein
VLVVVGGHLADIGGNLDLVHHPGRLSLGRLSTLGTRMHLRERGAIVPRRIYEVGLAVTASRTGHVVLV